jgi:hypothetical protein
MRGRANRRTNESHAACTPTPAGHIQTPQQAQPLTDRHAPRVDGAEVAVLEEVHHKVLGGLWSGFCDGAGWYHESAVALLYCLQSAKDDIHVHSFN